MESKEIKGYKGFDENLQCKDFQYKVGKTYTSRGIIELRKNGFLFFRELKDIHSSYNLSKSRVCEVIGFGKIEEDGNRIISEKITIVRELSKKEIIHLANICGKNSGFLNAGDYNLGDYNAGSFNSGHFNSGSFNAGNFNSGHANAGNFNSGQQNYGGGNSGNDNYGFRNVGNRNFGDRNVGDNNYNNFNVGSGNFGLYNVGNGNTGNYNTGSFNVKNYCVGDFNTKAPKVTVFNKKISQIEYEIFKRQDGFCILKKFTLSFYSIRRKGKKRIIKQVPYKQSWAIFWSTLSLKDRYAVYKLRYLDKKVFFDITGIRLHSGEKKTTWKK